MKKKLLFGTAACATVALSVAITLNFNFSGKNYDLSKITLTNVEALANSEGGGCCSGPKSVALDDCTTFCRCTNNNSCMDDSGCN